MPPYFQTQNQALNNEIRVIKNAPEAKQTLSSPVANGSATEIANIPTRIPYHKAAVVAIAIALIRSSSEFANASMESVILVWVPILILAAWVINFIANGIDR